MNNKTKNQLANELANLLNTTTLKNLIIKHKKDSKAISQLNHINTMLTKLKIKQYLGNGNSQYMSTYGMSSNNSMKTQFIQGIGGQKKFDNFKLLHHKIQGLKKLPKSNNNSFVIEMEKLSKSNTVQQMEKLYFNTFQGNKNGPVKFRRTNQSIQEQ